MVSEKSATAACYPTISTVKSNISRNQENAWSARSNNRDARPDMTKTSNKIAWICVGKMGLPMAALIVKAGKAVTAFDAPLRATMFGPQGLLQAMAPQSVLIETSTISAEVSTELDAAAKAREIAYLRAPVSGNASIAHTGALTCFVSGPQPVFERTRPLLTEFTRAQTYLGPNEKRVSPSSRSI